MNRVATRFALHQLVHWGAVGVMIPVATLVLREIGLSLLQIGLAIGAYSLATVLLEVPSGALSDLWGRRRTYFLSTLCDLLAVGLLLVAPGVVVVVIASALRGCARAFSSGSLDALAVETIRRETPDYDLQRFFARVGMAVPAGLAITSLAGGFLPELAVLSGLRALAAWSPAGGFGVNLFAHAALVGLAGTLAWVLFDEPRLTPVRSPESDIPIDAAAPAAAHDAGPSATPVGIAKQIGRSLAAAVRTPGLALILAASAAIGLVLLSVETYWQPRLGSIVGTDDVRLFGVLGAGYFAVAVLGSALSPLVVRLLGGNRAVGIIVFRVLSAAALLVLARQSGAAGFAGGYLGFFFVFASASPAEAAMLNELIEDENRSTLISVSSLMAQAGGVLGSLLSGWLSQSAGIGTSWTVAAAVFALSALLFVPLVRSDAARSRE